MGAMNSGRSGRWVSALGIACVLACGVGVLGLAQAPSDSAAVQSAVEMIVAAYVRALAPTGAAIGAPPEVVVQNTPNLIHFSPLTNRIVVPFWPPQESTLTFFLTLSGGDETQAQELFGELFHWFLVAHEMTHWLQHAGAVALDHYDAEARANDGAVAFYSLASENEERLLRLDALLAAALGRLRDPTPPALDPVTYFNAFYPSLAGDPYRYGYYQFRFIRDSIARRSTLLFAAVATTCLSTTPTPAP